MAILFYGPDIGGFSHLWMRRDFDLLAPHIDTLLEHSRPEKNFYDRARVVILPSKKPSGGRIRRFLHDVQQDMRKSKKIEQETARPEIDKVVVHFLNNAVPYRKVWERIGKPVYVFCHGIDVTWETTGADRTWRKLWWGDYVEEVRKMSANVTFVANSKVTKKRLTDIGINPKRIAVNYLGVPLPDQPLHRNSQKDAVTILYIGRLVDVKGPDLSIQAFEEARRKGMKGELIIAGDGPVRRECERLTDASEYSGDIHLLGSVTAERGEQLRREADIFTAHSRKGPVSKQEESYGVAFVEAMAAGLPVVTGRSGGLPEIMQHGRHGLLFESGNISEHADCLYQLWRDFDRRLELGKSASSHAAEHFSLESEKERLFSILSLNNENRGH